MSKPKNWLPLPDSEGKRLRTLVAVHEAGHAVVASVFGARAGYVTIIPTTRTGGHCAMPISDGDEGALAMLSAAGDCAVEIYRPGGAEMLDDLMRSAIARERQRRSDHVADDSPCDRESVSAMIKADAMMRPGEPLNEHAMTAAVAYSVADILFAQWEAVQSVAYELVNHKTLPAARVAEIVGIRERLTVH